MRALVYFVIGIALFGQSWSEDEPSGNAGRYNWGRPGLEPMPIIRIAPKIAQNCTSGWVEVAFEVLPTGKVANTQVLASFPTTHNDDAVVATTLAGRWKPGIVDGQPVQSVGHKVRVTINCDDNAVVVESIEESHVRPKSLLSPST